MKISGKEGKAFPTEEKYEQKAPKSDSAWYGVLELERRVGRGHDGAKGGWRGRQVPVVGNVMEGRGRHWIWGCFNGSLQSSGYEAQKMELMIPLAQSYSPCCEE